MIFIMKTTLTSNYKINRMGYIKLISLLKNQNILKDLTNVTLLTLKCTSSYQTACRSIH